jgi:hypothetical protein
MVFLFLRSLAKLGPTGRDRKPRGRMVNRRESLLEIAGIDRNVVSLVGVCFGVLFVWGEERENFVLSEEEIKKAMAVEHLGWERMTSGHIRIKGSFAAIPIISYILAVCHSWSRGVFSNSPPTEIVLRKGNKK